MKTLRKDEEAVSAVIGVILMVAITVILAAVIAAFVFGMKTPQQAATVGIKASSNLETTAKDIKISHTGGDTLAAKDWQVSIKNAGSSPTWKTGTTEFTSGDVIIATGFTSGTNVTVTNTTISSDTNLTAGKYDVKIKQISSNTVLFDSVVEVT